MLKAVLTTLILGASSVALATPNVRDQGSYYPYDDDRSYNGDRGYDRGYYDRDYYDGDYYDGHHDYGDHAWHRRPVLLAQGVRLSGLRERPTWIPLDRYGGAIHALRFDLAYGVSYIDHVVVFYADGHRETIPVRQPLTAYQRSATIQLPHAGVTGLYIYGTQMRGRFGRAGGAVDVVGLRR